MRFESKLCHISENKAVVQVNAWLNDQNLGSSLAEGLSVEDAEDKAISRLNQRLNTTNNKNMSLKQTHAMKINSPVKGELPNNKKKEYNNIKSEPIDWSNELTAIDLEIERLKWSRDDEILFLEKNLGLNSRNKITNYSDIIKYLDLIKEIETPNLSEIINKNISSLIDESESLLKDLCWDYKKGSEFLQKEFNVSTRKELNENQLISFIAKLKTIRNRY